MSSTFNFGSVNNFRCGNIVSSKGSITINGQTFSGNNVSVVNGKVIIDGKEQELAGDEKVLNITINGNCGDVELSQGDITVNGNVNGKVYNDQGSIKCGDVGGNVTNNQGSIRCGDIKGNATTNMGNIHRS